MMPITRVISVFPPIARSAILVAITISIENSRKQKQREFYIPFRFATLLSRHDRPAGKSGVFLRPYRLLFITFRTNAHRKSAIEMKRRWHQPVENNRHE
ncbi:hypothetical protein [Neorhizobium galegae]|uniref:hypothetical protein n=1 Tax=Neorhizobium galegae TaxID=399 RepID=UPI00126B564A|nr:hypothetical protein [Neorhizobium galegae]KAA9387672.1 hypothetical protein F4V88_14990 [Neorhizobium galegae]MCM2499064.1 hypothetical protein [Neorhizobium galegae]